MPRISVDNFIYLAASVFQFEGSLVFFDEQQQDNLNTFAEMTINLFDASYYSAHNSDLAKAGLTTNDQLYSHFQAYGLNEGRAFSPYVDLGYYSQSNPDLAKAGLTTDKQLLNHLQQYGVAEGRSFSPFVDLNFYTQEYSDLSKAFGGNQEQALQHLIYYGM